MKTWCLFQYSRATRRLNSFLSTLSKAIVLAGSVCLWLSQQTGEHEGCAVQCRITSICCKFLSDVGKQQAKANSKYSIHVPRGFVAYTYILLFIMLTYFVVVFQRARLCGPQSRGLHNLLCSSCIFAPHVSRQAFFKTWIAFGKQFAKKKEVTGTSKCI